MPSIIIAPECSIHAFVRWRDPKSGMLVTANRHFGPGDTLNVTPINAQALVSTGAASAATEATEAPEVIVMNEVTNPGWKPLAVIGR